MPTYPDIASIHAAYQAQALSPLVLIEEIVARIDACAEKDAIFICQPERVALYEQAARMSHLLLVDPAVLQRKPLFGIPFVVKDNIDVAGLPSTCACPDFAYEAAQSATVVKKLEAAGAIFLGKTNLDQFATGLVGTRSPYGEVNNPFNPDYISGGSSSGSAAAVALGFAAFALGTDTAGSGRVPAGFCNLVGIKPTPGLVSTQGVFPACKSLDCVSVFSHTVADGWAVLSVLAGQDAEDAYSRTIPALPPLTRKVRIGLPAPLDFLGDEMASAAFHAALALLKGQREFEFIEVPLAPFTEVAQLLYDGPWVCERLLAIEDFYRAHGSAIDPAVHSVIAQAEGKTANEVFAALYRLEAGKRMAEAVFQQVDLMLVPTTPTIYTRAQIAADPIARNSDLGMFTNFVNLLGLCALALPGPFRGDGLPAGLTLLAASGGDHRLAAFAHRIAPLLHRRLGLSADTPPYSANPILPLPSTETMVTVAVVGAHLSGMPLNWQLLERSGSLLRTTRTAAQYRLFALPGTVPPKPGLVRVPEGAAIEVEVWQLPARHYGSFVTGIPSPLGIGMVKLEDDSEVQCFLCDPLATLGAEDISHFGGWRRYMQQASV